MTWEGIGVESMTISLVGVHTFMCGSLKLTIRGKRGREREGGGGGEEGEEHTI